jgi:hypothetical protein
MKAERASRVRSGFIAGLLAGGILFGIVWLFGYITGNRLGFPLLVPISIIIGLMAGAQAYSMDPEDKAAKEKGGDNDTVALLRKQAEERARKR